MRADSTATCIIPSSTVRPDEGSPFCSAKYDYTILIGKIKFKTGKSLQSKSFSFDCRLFVLIPL